jgi:hypothetical protein
MELCPPSGLKAVPPPDKLAHFSKLVPTLNPDFVCPALLDCLEEGQPWIIRAKALCVMETTLYGGMQSNGTNPYRDFFHACQDEILPMAGHPRAAISGPAKRVLALLGVDGGAVDAAAAAARGGGHETPLTAAAPNLLDFDDDAPAPAPVVGPVVGAVSSMNGGGGGDSSLFGGMQLKSSTTTKASPSEPSTSGIEDFGVGMQVKSATPAPASAPSLLDDFPGSSTSEAASQSIFRPSDMSTTARMFDQMTLKSTQEDKKTDSEDAGDLTASYGASNGGSAFGFINSASSKDSSANGAMAGPFDHPAPAVSAPPPPPPSAESFDPLKNFSPNSSKKSMTLSPEQMQAMAYQQIMMQQQQIHLQRMMMQQQGMVFAPGMPGGVVPVMPGVGSVLPGMPPLAAGGGGGQSMASLFKPPPASSGAPQAKKDDKKFDFVKDAMQTAGKK